MNHFGSCLFLFKPLPQTVKISKRTNLSEELMFTIRKLDNGIKTIIQKVPYLNSTTVGIIVESGSFYESSENNGISHFIEHMLFKGTKNRTARQIAETIDDIGGQLNAFTSKEHTCYYAKVLSEHLNIAVEVLSDMLLNSNFELNEIEKEKGVIIEEINMYQDFPEDLAFELLTEMLYGEMGLAKPILGTEETVRSFSREQLLDYYFQKYNPSSMVIAVVGNLEPDEGFELLNKAFGDFHSGIYRDLNIPSYHYSPVSGIEGISKEIEQMNLCIGFTGPSTYSEDIFPLMVVNNILGGSMSSRLFQEARENLGLVYNIESSITSYNGAGMLSIYSGLSIEQVNKVASLIKKELDTIRNNYISEAELKKSKEHLKGSYILSLESSFNKMYEMGKSILHDKEVETPEDVMREINSVDMSSIQRVVDRYLDWHHLNISYVGDVKDKLKFESDLKNIFLTGDDGFES
jgi:predicted Zn-dependent peptidase